MTGPMPRRFAALFAFLILTIALLLVAVWVLLEERAGGPAAPTGPPVPALPPEPELLLEPATFDDLPGWNEDDLTAALPALVASCEVFAKRPGDSPLGEGGAGGTAGDWLPVCVAVESAERDGWSAELLRSALEARLRPWAVTDRGIERSGLVTGYYEPELRGSRRRHGRFQTPLYRAPRDLIAVDLGSFREDLAGRRIAGRVVGGRLEPYHDRKAIVRGALSGKGLELVWVDDPVGAFFLQVQGSGRVTLEDGSVLRVGYAAQNGHPYTAIGRELVARGELTLEEVSLQTIRRWLEEHPDQAPEVMAANASFVFFRPLDGRGPLGSLGVPLTPERSLAVDPRFLPLGAPVWLAGSMPRMPTGTLNGAPPDGPRPLGDRPLRRLVVAQDTGGAIRGPLRGDLFWGAGERAEVLAGHMKHLGRFWLLLPVGAEGASPSE